MVKQLFTE